MEGTMGRHSVAYARRIRSLVRLLVVLSLCLACTVPGHTAARPRTQSQPAGEIAYVDQADIWLLDVVTK